MSNIRNWGILEIIEILQVGTILFVFAAIGSFLISIPFTELDKVVKKIDNKSTQNIVIFTQTYIQLIVTAIAYFYIEKVIYLFPSLVNKLSKNYQTYKSTNYVIHIILILVLIEMNGSLVRGVHHIQKELNVNWDHEDYY